MHIRLNMAEGQYMAASAHHRDSIRRDCLPSACTTEPTSTAAYQAQDLTPYSTVASFSYPATAEPTLMTPVSSSGSPSLQQRHSLKGIQYPSQAIPGPQQPTPPNSGLYYPSYDISHPSSPLNAQPQSPEAPFHNNMSPYVTHSPPLAHHSPKNEVPPPPNQYLGHYSVSGACNEAGMPNSFGECPNFNTVGNGFLTRGPPPMQVSAPPMHHQMAVTTAGPTSILAHPSSAHFRTQLAARPGAIEDLRDVGMFAHGLPGPGTYQSPAPPVPRKGRRQPAARRGRGNAVRRASRNSPGRQEQQLDDEQTGQGQVLQEPLLPLQLLSGTPAEIKYVIEARRNHAGEKGHGMWESIAEEYATKFPPMGVPALQMKVNRGVARYIDWPEEERQALMAAFKHDEETRYERLRDKMKNLGGGRVWDWSAGHIELKLVDLGLENSYVDERTGSRRKPFERKKQGNSKTKSTDQAMAGDWTNGLGLQTVMTDAPPQAYPVAHGHAPPSDYDLVNGQRSVGVVAGMPEQQRESLLDHIFGSLSVEPEISSALATAGDAMDVTETDSQSKEFNKSDNPTTVRRSSRPSTRR